MHSQTQDLLSPSAVYNVGQTKVSNPDMLNKLKQDMPNFYANLPGLFKYCTLLKRYERQPDVSLEANMLQLIERNFDVYSPYVQPIWRRDETYPMNKLAGAFSNSYYERDCKINEKNFIQLDEKGNLKPFDIKKFEQPYYFNSSKSRKLPWSKKGANHKWRIVVVDGKGNERAIYTKTQAEAIYIRDYCHIVTKKQLKFPAIVVMANKFSNKKYAPAATEEILRMMEQLPKHDVPREMSINPKDGSSPINHLAMSPSNQSIGMTNSYMVPNTPSERNGGNNMMGQSGMMGPTGNSMANPNNGANNMMNSNVSNGSSNVGPNRQNNPFYPTQSKFQNMNGQNSMQPPQNMQPTQNNMQQNSPMTGMTINLMKTSTLYNKKKTLSNLNFDKQAVGNVIENWLHKSMNRSQSASPDQPNLEPTQSFRLKPFPFYTSLLQEYYNIVAYNFTLRFKKLEIMSNGEMFTKPRLAISIYKGYTVIVNQTYETMLEKTQPYYVYGLIGNTDFNLRENIMALRLRMEVRDRISNNVLSDGVVPFNIKERYTQTCYVRSTDGVLRLEMEYLNHEQRKRNISSSGLVLNVSPVSAAYEAAIKRYWKEYATKKDYYSHEIELDMIEVLSKIYIVPKYWWMGLTEDEYQVLSLLEAATKILDFVVIYAHLPIVKALLYINSFSERPVDESCRQALSIITSYMSPYYMKDQMNKIHYLHRFVGLDTDCGFPNRLGLYMAIVDRLLLEERPQLMGELQKKNIHVTLLLFEYIYEMFSNNFNIRTLTVLWNDVFKDRRYVQHKLICLAVVLVGQSEYALLELDVKSKLRIIMEKKYQTFDESQLLADINLLTTKYFTPPQGLINTIAVKLFSQSIFYTTINQFYKTQSKELQDNLDKKVQEKSELMSRLVDRVPFKLPVYPSRQYNLHLYFPKFPSLEGLLHIKAGSDEYECSNKSSQQYFIVENVSEQVEVYYVHRGKKWATQLQMVQGIHTATMNLKITNELISEYDISIDYVCGLLTEAQYLVIKKAKPSEHFISSYMQLDSLITYCCRPPQQCQFLRDNNTLPYELLQMARVLFSSGGNKFNEVDFYLSWIQNLKLPIFDKIEQLKLYSQNIGTYQYLCQFPSIFKLLFRELLTRMSFPLSDSAFECHLNSRVAEFNSPRIIEAMFVSRDGKTVELTVQTLKYVTSKGSRGLLNDVILTSKAFFYTIRKPLQDALGEPYGFMIIKYSSSGAIKKVEVPLITNRDTRELQINTRVNFVKQYGVSIREVDPEVLTVESYPAFSRITKMFDNVSHADSQTSNKLARLPAKEYFNLLHMVADKLDVVLPMRYKEYPTEIKFPFLSYFCYLTAPIVYAPLPKLLFQGEEWNPKRICTYRGGLEISDNQQGENFPVDKRIGLQANIAKWGLVTPIVYFWKVNEEKIERTTWKVLVNYGLGVFREEMCQVRGYVSNSKNNQKYYVVLVNGYEKLFRYEDIEIPGENPFGYIDVSREEYLQRRLKAIYGRTEAEKTAELIDRRKFTNFLALKR